MNVNLRLEKLNLSCIFRWIQANVSGELSKDLQQLLADNKGEDIKLAHSDYNWNLNNIAPAKI